MKIMSIVRLTLGLFLAICFQQVVLASDNPMIRAIALGQDAPVMQPEKLAEDIAAATTKMNDARKQLFGAKTQAEDRKNVNIIIQQNSIIVHANHDLRKLNEELEKGLDDTELEQGYLGKLKDVGSSILGQVKGLYAYTEDEKEIARQIIDGLKDQKQIITQECLLKLKGLNPALRNQLKIRYKEIMTQMNAAIHKQQVITGEAMSLGQKVAWGAVGAAAATAAGLALADKYGETIMEEVEKTTLLQELPQDQKIEQLLLKEIKGEQGQIVVKSSLVEETKKAVATQELSQDQKVEQLPSQEIIKEELTPLSLPQQHVQLEQQNVKVVEQQVAQPTEQPIEQSVEQPVEKLVEQPIQEPVTQPEEITSVEPEVQLQPADELLLAAKKDLEQAENLGASTLREKDRVKIAEFIKKRLDESPSDSEALDYLNQLQLADEKIAQIEAKDNEYRERIGWWNYWVTLQPEGIAIMDELKAAKAAKAALQQELINKIDVKSE